MKLAAVIQVALLAACRLSAMPSRHDTGHAAARRERARCEMSFPRIGKFLLSAPRDGFRLWGRTSAYEIAAALNKASVEKRGRPANSGNRVCQVASSATLDYWPKLPLSA